MTNDVLQFLESHLGEVFANFLCEEEEIVDKIFRLSDEVLAQFGILRCYTERTGVEVTLTHHHTTKHDECGSTESVFFSTEKCHEHDVATCLKLSVNLNPDVTTKTVLDECLLCL